jgi:hypothetical protein
MNNVSFLLIQDKHRIGVAIGDQILDLSVVKHLFENEQLQQAFQEVSHTYLLTPWP